LKDIFQGPTRKSFLLERDSYFVRRPVLIEGALTQDGHFTSSNARSNMLIFACRYADAGVKGRTKTDVVGIPRRTLANLFRLMHMAPFGLFKLP